MPTLSLPIWPAFPALDDQGGFRTWLKSTAHPNGGPVFGGRQTKLHACVAPLAVGAELWRGSNEMVINALSTGSDHLPERLEVVSARILDCLEAASGVGRVLVGELSARVLTPIDVEDVYRLSRLFVRGVERMAVVAATLSVMRLSDPALHPIHDSLGRSLAMTLEALNQLGDRERAHALVLNLSAEHREARGFCRRYFDGRLEPGMRPEELAAQLAARSSYAELMAHSGAVPAALYRTALKNS